MILAFESSCDDSAIALMDAGTRLLFEKRVARVSEHQKYGGIVPEIAARNHAVLLVELLAELLAAHQLDLTAIAAIAYTQTPGLKSCLLTAEMIAYSLAYLLNKPLLPVNHLYGHLFSPFLNRQLTYPFLGLVASGKTTSIYLVNNLTEIIELTRTVDDAVGEAFDKVGRMLGLAYPAGPLIDKLYQPELATLKLAKMPASNKPFSFSGIKTAVKQYLSRQLKLDVVEQTRVLSSFQKYVIDVIMNKIIYYQRQYQVNVLAVSGGVAANSLLRQRCAALAMQTYLVERKYATDNAVMIAFLANLVYQSLPVGKLVNPVI